MHLFVQIHPVAGTQLSQSFEGLAQELNALPGMYFEMDGSFVWVDHERQPPSQMDGMVYDLNGSLQYVEVKGNCSPNQWTLLCDAICGIRKSMHAADPFTSTQSFDSKIRVHNVAAGEWTTCERIAMSLDHG